MRKLHSIYRIAYLQILPYTPLAMLLQENIVPYVFFQFCPTCLFSQNLGPLRNAAHLNQLNSVNQSAAKPGQRSETPKHFCHDLTANGLMF